MTKDFFVEDLRNKLFWVIIVFGVIQLGFSGHLFVQGLLTDHGTPLSLGLLGAGLMMWFSGGFMFCGGFVGRFLYEDNSYIRGAIYFSSIVFDMIIFIIGASTLVFVDGSFPELAMVSGVLMALVSIMAMVSEAIFK